MSENTKIGLMGFDRLKLFPIIENSADSYATGEGVSLPSVQSMTKEKDVSEQKVYADDSLYLNVVNFNGLNAEITLAQLSLAQWSALGFGEYDEESHTLKWNPQGANKEFAMTFRCLQAGGGYRMYRMYRFTVSSVEESETNTKGEKAGVSPYKISGTFSPRAVDNAMGEIHDGDNIEWLDSIPAEGE